MLNTFLGAWHGTGSSALLLDEKLNASPVFQGQRADFSISAMAFHAYTARDPLKRLHRLSRGRAAELAADAEW